MTTTTASRPRTVNQARVGAVVSVLAGVFLLFDAVIHVLRIGPVVESFADLGFQASVAVPIGILELACVALYAIPRTSVLGAIMLTGYLGGAVCAHVRVESPLFSTTLFPVYLGIAVWAGLYLRNAKLRALLAA
ncbi:MAG: DoxX family protein [Actinophytocola sp.]|uniref:DoxX family protein n=1 Tax=Actinophytocola sp. TaxID=1872138 RepID=UPI00132AFDA0|nr:DoxX family protein [Actinophytocola sp.]MPZ85081.1 DoxX family protein [Actinophytocola sp.]